MQCKDETIAVLEDIEEAQFDECDDCFDDHTDAGSRAEENDVLEVLEVQPGHDIPGVHMPPRLQQLRGNALISGLPRDEQIFHDEHKTWKLRLAAEKRAGTHDHVIAMLDGAAEDHQSDVAGSVALSIPFLQIDAARVAGAVLHPVSGLWYAPAGADLTPLQQ